VTRIEEFIRTPEIRSPLVAEESRLATEILDATVVIEILIDVVEARLAQHGLRERDFGGPTFRDAHDEVNACARKIPRQEIRPARVVVRAGVGKRGCEGICLIEISDAGVFPEVPGIWRYTARNGEFAASGQDDISLRGIELGDGIRLRDDTEEMSARDAPARHVNRTFGGLRAACLVPDGHIF